MVGSRRGNRVRDINAVMVMVRRVKRDRTTVHARRSRSGKSHKRQHGQKHEQVAENPHGQSSSFGTMTGITPLTPQGGGCYISVCGIKLAKVGKGMSQAAAFGRCTDREKSLSAERRENCHASVTEGWQESGPTGFQPAAGGISVPIMLTNKSIMAAAAVSKITLRRSAATAAATSPRPLSASPK
jgi:hypothetical protein